MKHTTRWGRLALARMPWAMLALMLSVALPAGGAAGLQPGKPMPAIALKDSSGTLRRMDERATATAILVFVKPGDKFLKPALGALNDMLAKHPVLSPAGLRRVVVVSRFEEGQAREAARAVAVAAGPGWQVLVDEADKAYHACGIIATPTVAIVGPGLMVAADHPGYDLGMQEDMRKALAKALGVKLPDAASTPPPKPNMHLQMARRMAARGLWDSALAYFQKAAAQGPLPDAAQTELAEVYLEMGKPAEALATLARVPAASPAAKRAAELAARAHEMQAGQAGQTGPAAPHQPPKVTR